jgi:hypothetical protein
LQSDQRTIEPRDLAPIPKMGSQMRFIRRLAGRIDDK